ncbi:putative diguanylate cyclase YeaP [Andreprevotia sp. IGB-42]|uniref:sensor domain-containing diguanylate cyclase n=1 Tax=Andreprevotia sp. IGB-42 TaxID=2497473 RepID=UPI0013582025|nr:GGDEF domain-containing protein [Andreprevotia sp. IGB-42]KAF0813445.1 putative diguanylate cyclase YeaP [Andreprevotia sp. IGB-42]
MSEALIPQLSDALDSEKTFEGLVRRLLVMLELATDLESTYLTKIDLDAGLQNILFSRNTKTLTIPEGLSVPWSDTLCKRAMDENVSYTDDVANRWGDSEAAKALGIETYASTKICLEDGSVYGTLCAASSTRKPMTADGQQFFELFAQLISHFAQKEQLLRKLQVANAALHQHSYTDALTGLCNRRAVFEELARLFAQARRSHQLVVIAFIDLDGFKKINDVHGHEAGDAFLVEVAQRLTLVLRAGDVLGRLGGDEFVIGGLGPANSAETAHAAAAMKARLGPALVGHYNLGSTEIDYLGASIGVISVDPAALSPKAALQAADEAMYEEKSRRRAAA